MKRAFLQIAEMDARHRLATSLVAAAIFGFFVRKLPLWTASLATYDSFALIGLVLLWISILYLPRQTIRKIAKHQDVGTTLIFFFAVAATCAALLAVIFLIRGARADSKNGFSIHIILTVLTVLLSWLYMHTVFALRYAHTFYGDSDESSQQHAGGLDFPREKWPEYTDFAYFSFVIGMTCQVSDVQVTSRDLRRLVLAHGLLSFAFNTAILAFTLNIVSSLLGN